jgi:phosphoglycolate phosphatase
MFSSSSRAAQGQPWQPVMFDLDGTLLDSAPAVVSRLRDTMIAFGVEPPTESELRHLIGPPTPVALGGYIAPERIDESVAFYRSLVAREGLDNMRLFAGISDALAQLHDRGIPLAVATSKLQGEAERIVTDFGIADYLTVVVGASPERATKADVVARALVELETAASHTPLMVGDRRWDIEGAAEHGVPTVLVSWGYASPEEFDLALARIESPDELVSFVLGQEA